MDNQKIIDMLFEIRLEDIAHITPTESELLKKSTTAYDNLIELIESNLSSEEDRKKANDYIDNFYEDFALELGAYSEKYYKQGFADAIRLIIECLTRND